MKTISTLALSISAMHCANAATVLIEDFEDPTTVGYSVSDTVNNLITAENITEIAGNDYYGKVDYSGSNTPPNVSITSTPSLGSSYFGANHTDGLSNGDDDADFLVLTWTGLNISNFTDLSFSGFFAEDDATDGNQDWDQNSSVIVSYSIDGSAFLNLFAIEAASGFSNVAPLVDTDFDGVGDGAEITNTMTEYTSAINGTGNTLDLKVEITYLDTSEEDIAFDNISITGNLVPEPSSLGLLLGGGLFLLGKRKRS